MAELKGLVAHNPQRYAKELPIADQPLGQAPEYLTDEEKAVWFEIESFAPRGVPKGRDRILIEVTCRLVAWFREDPRAFPVGLYAQLVGCLARLGMSPADHQKLGVEKAPKVNPFDRFGSRS